MKTFDEIYEELQNANNSELSYEWELAKEERKKTNIITGIICAIIDILIVIMSFKNAINSGFLFFLLYIIIFALITNLIIIAIAKVFFSKKQNKFNIKYKNIVINKLMSNFYNNLEYFPNKSMPEYIYKEAKYNEYHNRYKSEDYLEGQIDNKSSIQMAEVITQNRETYRDSEGNICTRTITRFYGLFAKIVMHKSINGELKIMKDGKLLLDNKLKMDSSEFEKYFDVKASNAIVGMQLLTADVMEELVEFENKTNMIFDIIIKNNEIYLRFHSGEMFEVKNFKKGLLDKESIQKYFCMLNFTYNLSKRLINLIDETEI